MVIYCSYCRGLALTHNPIILPKKKKIDFPVLYYFCHLVMAYRTAGLDVGSLRTRSAAMKF